MKKAGPTICMKTVTIKGKGKDKTKQPCSKAEKLEDLVCTLSAAYSMRDCTGCLQNAHMPLLRAVALRAMPGSDVSENP
jgi:hypothetical protein